MRKIIVAEMITLDGVMQAPGSPEEDPSGDFQLGGWTAPCGDELGLEVLKKQMEPADYLLGGKTFRIWEPYWPNHADFWPGINSGTKYVLSKQVRLAAHRLRQRSCRDREAQGVRRSRPPGLGQ